MADISREYSTRSRAGACGSVHHNEDISLNSVTFNDESSVSKSQSETETVDPKYEATKNVEENDSTNKSYSHTHDSSSSTKLEEEKYHIGFSLVSWANEAYKAPASIERISKRHTYRMRKRSTRSGAGSSLKFNEKAESGKIMSGTTESASFGNSSAEINTSVNPAAIDSIVPTTWTEMPFESSTCTNKVLSSVDKFFCCPKCCSYFEAASFLDFKKHLTDDCLVRKKHPCSQCGHVFISQSVLHYHINQVHTNPNPLSNIHRVKPRKTKNVSSKMSFEENDVQWPDNVSQAKKIAAETEIWKCWICSYESPQKGLWQTHMNRIHPDVLGISLECVHCSFSFTKKYHLREHLQEVHSGEIGFKCKNCGRILMSKNFKHACKKIQCEVCGIFLNSRGEKTKHLLLAHPKHRPYKCTECSKEFTRNEYLTIHTRVHRDLRPYDCEFCERRFRSKSHYNNHRRLHTGEKPYTCHVCGKSFFSPQCLCNHMVTHTGIKKHECSDCNISFRTKHDFIRHQMIHSGLKPFACKTCGKTFNRRGNCTVHERSHFALKKEFKCETCGKDFDRLKKLNRHVRDIHLKPQITMVMSTSESGELSTVITDAEEIQSQPDLKRLTVQFLDVEDVASNVEVVGEETEASEELELQQLRVWEQAEFEFLNEDGTHVIPMYVTVLPCSDSASASDPENETVGEIQVLDAGSNSLHIEFENATEAKAYLEIVKTE